MVKVLNYLRAKHAAISRHPDLQGFDEAFYLEENPDIANAVARGRQPSGRSHYLRFGRFERRVGKPMPPNPPGYDFPGPLPPQPLRRRVHGTGEATSFEWVGKNTSDDLIRALPGRLSLSAGSRILDFGCGCGRVMAYLRQSVPGQLFGSDIDAEAIAWCTDNLGAIGAFSLNEPLPPLPFDSDSFDLVYSISVFTHLPEDMQDAWLAELRRVARSGACLLISVQGTSMLPDLPAPLRARFADSGFLHIQAEATDGLPDFYQRTFHAAHYLESHWGAYFAVEEIRQTSVAENQDLVICRKR